MSATPVINAVLAAPRATTANKAAPGASGEDFGAILDAATGPVADAGPEVPTQDAKNPAPAVDAPDADTDDTTVVSDDAAAPLAGLLDATTVLALQPQPAPQAVTPAPEPANGDTGDVAAPIIQAAPPVTVPASDLQGQPENAAAAQAAVAPDSRPEQKAEIAPTGEFPDPALAAAPAKAAAEAASAMAPTTVPVAQNKGAVAPTSAAVARAAEIAAALAALDTNTDEEAPADTPLPVTEQEAKPADRPVSNAASATVSNALGSMTGKGGETSVKTDAATASSPASADATTKPAPAVPTATEAAPVPTAGAAALPADAPVTPEPVTAATTAPAPATPSVHLTSSLAGLSTLSQSSAATMVHLAAQISKRLEGRSTQFEMTLTPEDLGRVDVSLDIDADGQLSARLAFDNPLAATDLKSRADELRRQLEDAGFTLSKDALEFSQRDGSAPGGGFDRRQNRAFANASRNALDADVAQPAAWMSLTLTPRGVDMKV